MIQALAGIIVAVIGVAAAWLSNRHAMTQKRKDAAAAVERKEVIDRDELRTRADAAEIKAREQLWSQMMDELNRMKDENLEMRKRLRLTEEDHEKERRRLWDHSRKQDIAINECEERSSVQALEIAALKAELSKHIKDSC